jgi:hypothetical protein
MNPIQWFVGWLPSTVSPVELLWTFPAVVGLVHSIIRYGRAYRQRWRQQHHKPKPINGKLGIAATARCVRALCLTVIFLLSMLAGAYAMVLPEGPASDPSNIDSWILATLLFGAQVILLLMGWLLDFYEASIVTLVALEAEASEKRKREQVTP